MIDINRGSSSDPSIYLVLQSDRAYWFQFHQNELVDSYAEPVVDDVLQAASHCPWLSTDSSSSPVSVHLIFDSLLDELDDVTLNIRGATFLNWLQRIRCVRHVRKSYKQASVNAMPEQCFPVIASVLHHIIADQWERWLLALQNQGVLFVSVVSATELLLECSKSMSTVVLFDISAGAERRHFLAAHGVPRFLKVASAEDERSLTEEPEKINDSLLHSLRLIEQENRCPEGDLMLAQWYDDNSVVSAECRDAMCLVSLMVGRVMPLNVRKLKWSSDNQTLEPLATHSSSRPDETLPAVRRRLSGCAWLSNLTGVGDSIDALLRQRWSLMRSIWAGNSALEPSTQNLRILSRMGQLKTLTVSFAVFGLILMVCSSWYGINDLLDRKNLKVQYESNTASTANLARQTLELTDSPESIALSMQLIDSFLSVATPDAGILFVLLADALSVVPAVSLDRLTWMSTGETERYDQSFTMIDRVELRQDDWSSQAQAEKLRVEISGEVTGKDLSEQSRHLDQFLEVLRSTDVVFDINVMESPVDSAQSSHLVSGHVSSYRVALQLSAG